MNLVELIPLTLMPLCAYLRQCQGVCTCISFIDSTPLAVWLPQCWVGKRIPGVGTNTASLPGRLNGAKARPDDFSDSSSIWSSMIKATCSTWR